MIASPWTPERVEKIVHLWVNEAKSGQQIANILGDTTRHAVINKLHSLGVYRGRDVSVNEVLSSLGIEPENGVTIEELTSRHCRFPLWRLDDTEKRYCGKKRVAGSPYCEEHARLAKK